ncbi:hypothetical protein SmJEL517_g00717 [Synchytrium microbalum]|uniref:serine C-palmitoyltransferase n=1 Tax=Synchytrium microbalum TaxID=1806994 RepID=A0A507CHT2_9FUNG|nr:uncharacterized protein SmJEL517_g00717 [Synchytrium microbalum]TPX37676.1 hypothetical protein SmJEL517_g00717 [Synchytrium microbalum]
MGKGAADLLFAISMEQTTKPLYTKRLPTVDSNNASYYPAHRKAVKPHHTELEPPLRVTALTYTGFIILACIGIIRNACQQLAHFVRHYILGYISNDALKPGYAPLNEGFEVFFRAQFYRFIKDCFHRPITGVPGSHLTILERVSDDYNKTFTLTGRTQTVLNLSSYNYLGFAQSHGPCADAVEEALEKFGMTTSSPRMEAGSTTLHTDVERLVARYIGQEDAVVLSMGFATNSTTLPAIVEQGSLVISDALNHASLVYGCRISGASIKSFKHNDMNSLEKVLRDAIANGQGGKNSSLYIPWKKILVVVEGLYSMEGTICPLPQILELKRKYKFFLYIDEAHSIGAIGPKGRGVCDFYGVNPREVDILMGTFTKAFSAAGGYISGSRDLINRIRLYNHSSIFAESMSIPVLQQIYTSMTIIMGEDGTSDGRRRIEHLAKLTRRFRDGLKGHGFLVMGDDNSPVVPVLLCQPCKIGPFSYEMLERGVAVVIAGFPATPVTESRARFCLSSSHTMEDIDMALAAISEVGDKLDLKYLA